MMKKLLIKDAMSFRQEQHLDGADGADDKDLTDEKDSDDGTTQKCITPEPTVLYQKVCEVSLLQMILY